MGYIYEIRNTENNNCYVGSTSNLKKRWYEHKYSLKNGNHHSILFQRAWNKYGESSFVWNILIECDNSDLIQREQEYLDLGTEYNILKIADRPMGRKHSEKTKQQISEKLKGRKLSDEHIENMKGKQINKFVSEETKEKISVANKGKVRSEEYKKQSSENRKGSIPWNKNKKGLQQACNKQSVEIYKDEQLVNVFSSLIQTAEFLGVNQSAVSKALKSKTNKCKGYILKQKQKNND